MSIRPAVLFFLLLSPGLASPAFGAPPSRQYGSKTWTWTFAADTLGIAPSNTATFGGSWAVVVDSSRAGAHATATPGGASSPAESAAVADLASAPRVVRQSEDDDGIKFHYLQFKKPVLDDMAVSVRFRILGGQIDPTAGVMFQLDPKGRSGYLVRVSGQTSQLIAHYLLFGKRRDLRFAKIETPEPGTWHSIAVERKGSVMTVSYDGEEKFRMRDERFSSGSVGLWTEDDTIVDFEQLTVSTR